MKIHVLLSSHLKWASFSSFFFFSKIDWVGRATSIDGSVDGEREIFQLLIHVLNGSNTQGWWARASSQKLHHCLPHEWQGLKLGAIPHCLSRQISKEKKSRIWDGKARTWIGTLIWDASVTSWGLTGCARMPAPDKFLQSNFKKSTLQHCTCWRFHWYWENFYGKSLGVKIWLIPGIDLSWALIDLILFYHFSN